MNDVLTISRAQTSWFTADPETFQANFERIGFAFPHRLADHPLFRIEHLIELATSLSDDPSRVVYDAGDVRVDQRWDEVPLCDIPVAELIKQIETAGAWILLKHADKRPGYGELLEECLRDVEALIGRSLHSEMKARKFIVFLNSPHRVTSYHIDHQASFLLQIQGTKTISIFDRDDRDVLSERELENFWARDANAARYRADLQSRARTFELRPGMGVHIPVNAPHWVQNGPDVSVSLNFNIDFHDRIRGDLYRANYWLRRLGLSPKPPFVSASSDRAKATAFGVARVLCQAAASLRSASRARSGS